MMCWICWILWVDVGLGGWGGWWVTVMTQQITLMIPPPLIVLKPPLFHMIFYIFFPSWHCGFFAQTYLPIWLGGLFSWTVERIVSALHSYLILKTYMCLYFTTISSLDSRVRIFEMWRSLESGRLDIWDHYQRCSQSRSKSHKKSKSNFIYEVFSFTK